VTVDALPKFWAVEKLLENLFVAKRSSKSAKYGSNKKSELMLMRRARAYGSSCSQVILVYLHPFCHTSLFCSQKLSKNHLNSIFLGCKVIDVDIPNKLVASATRLCLSFNHFHARQDNSGLQTVLGRDGQIDGQTNGQNYHS